MPSIGKRINGNNATTGIGNASVTHHVIINAAIESTIDALSLIEKGLRKYKTRETTIPASSEISFSCCLETLSKKQYLNKNKRKGNTDDTDHIDEHRLLIKNNVYPFNLCYPCSYLGLPLTNGLPLI